MLFAGLCMAALATSCSDNLSETGGTQSVQLDATVSAENTRAAFNESGKFYWQSGDKIGVITSADAPSTKFTALTLKSGAGEGSATFEGTISGNLGSYAIYPYDEKQEVKNNTLTYTFPSSYAYSKVDQTFFPEAKDGNSFNPAMFASISGEKIAFKHLGGVFCINMESMPCANGTLTLTTDQSLCGKYTTTVGAGSTPELKSSSTESDGNNTVSIKFTGATQGQPGVFYIPAPTGTYTNATVTFTPTGDNTNATKVVAGTYKVERTYLKKLVLKTITIDVETVTEKSSVEDAQTALATSDNVALTAEVSGTTTITIPEATSTTTETETKAKTLTLQKVADNAEITVSDKNTSSESTDANKSVKELTVSIPNMDDANKAPKVTVTMPNSTVTLAGNAGTATFQEVTASTAENTLVVSEGVTVKKLIVAKGNVRVNKGATVEAIEKATDNSSGVIVYYEEGASVPSSVTDITLIKIPVGTQVISTEAQFATALTTGGNYILQNDLTLSTEYTVASTLTLDLNNKTLTAGANTIQVVGGNLTLKNGNVVQSKGNNKVGLHVGTNGTLVVDGITYTGEANCFNRIYVLPCQTNVNVTIKNSTIKGGYYSFFTDASTTTGVTSNCTVNLENSEFTANETGVVVNIPATVTMTNCKSSGNHQGALLRGGTYNISGCTFTLNASLESSNGENKWMKAWKSGNQCAFAALTIGNYQNGAYNYETKATFTGTNTTVVTGTNATSFPAIHVCSANSKAVTITGFNGSMTTPTSGCKTPVIEYGTTGITVDGSAATVNVNTSSNN